jgi:hypothetical protein
MVSVLYLHPSYLGANMEGSATFVIAFAIVVSILIYAVIRALQRMG